MLKSGQKFVRYRQKADIREQNLIFAASANHEIESHSTAVQNIMYLYPRKMVPMLIRIKRSVRSNSTFDMFCSNLILIALTFVPKGKQTASGFGLKAIHRTRKANRLAIPRTANRTSSHRTIRTESI